MTCSRCKAALTEDCRHCPQCGAPAISAARPTEVISERTLGPLLAPAASPEPSPADLAAVRSLLSQANLCRIRSQWKEAIDHCVSALRLLPGDQSAHSLLGDIYRDQGRTEEALHWYRLAVDLAPNAADEAKLRQLEQQYERRQEHPDRAKQAARSAPPSFASGTNLPAAGTTNLMGVSPRLWLRGLTVVSLAFAALMLFALFQMRARRMPDPIPMPVSSELTSLPSSNVLPPGRTGGSPYPNASRDGEAILGGGGFAPDRGRSDPQQNAPRDNPGASPETNTGSPLNLAPAPVTGVRPLETPVPSSESQENPPGDAELTPAAPTEEPRSPSENE